jgi:predicted molibdopterin-dependent oxidoreductase YjgC
LSKGKIYIKLNGIKTACEQGDTIKKVAKRAGVRIPTLCNDKRLDPYGACRLCSVEVKGVHRLLPACTTPVTDSLTAPAGFAVLRSRVFIDSSRPVQLRLQTGWRSRLKATLYTG